MASRRGIKAVKNHEVKIKKFSNEILVSAEVKNPPPGQPKPGAKKKLTSKESMKAEASQCVYLQQLHLISCMCEPTCVVLTWCAENKALARSVENLLESSLKESKPHFPATGSKHKTGNVDTDEHLNQLNILLLKLTLVWCFVKGTPESPLDVTSAVQRNELLKCEYGRHFPSTTHFWLCRLTDLHGENHTEQQQLAPEERSAGSITMTSIKAE